VRTSRSSQPPAGAANALMVAGSGPGRRVPRLGSRCRSDGVERYANNRIEADHGRLKHRLATMRGLHTDPTAAFIITGWRSRRTCATATTSSQPNPPGPYGSPPRLPNSAKRSDPVLGPDLIAPTEQLTQAPVASIAQSAPKVLFPITLGLLPNLTKVSAEIA